MNDLTNDKTLLHDYYTSSEVKDFDEEYPEVKNEENDSPKPKIKPTKKNNKTTMIVFSIIIFVVVMVYGYMKFNTASKRLLEPYRDKDFSHCDTISKSNIDVSTISSAIKNPSESEKKNLILIKYFNTALLNSNDEDVKKSMDCLNLNFYKTVTGETLINTLVKNSTVDLVKHFVETNPNYEYEKDINKVNEVHTAYLFNQPDIVVYLLKLRIDTYSIGYENYYDNTLKQAIESGDSNDNRNGLFSNLLNLEIIDVNKKLLIDKKNYSTMLFIAVENNNEFAVRKIINIKFRELDLTTKLNNLNIYKYAESLSAQSTLDKCIDQFKHFTGSVDFIQQFEKLK